MMNQIIKIILLLHTFSIFASAESNPYCNVNETSITYKPVVKTRQVYKKPTGTFKFLKKGKTFTEEYVDQEQLITWKLVSKCCEGYEMSALNLCAPICANDCPKNAQCVEPNLCHCQRGYISATSPKDGTHYCEPICTTDCPENGRCAAPNLCECERGFHVVDSKCIARHTATIISTDISKELETTMRNELNSDLNAMDMETEISTVNIDEMPLDELEKIYLTTESLTIDDDLIVADCSTIVPCDAGFEFYNGDCRRILFPSNAYDCRFKTCFANAQCLENGTCACIPGFSLDTVDLICLANVQHSNGSLGRQASNDETTSFLIPLLIALGLICIICGLIFVIVVIFRRQRGAMDIENGKMKNDLCCEYENNSFCESQNVL